ncbi:MAG: Peptidase associated domain protein [Firmicutes bacterium]|nr:Peptidase associated domain protein [Bacillota bacterium]
MKWGQAELYYGFRLEEEKILKDIHSTAKVFYHEKSGARLFFLENTDDNKVFSITFRTPPGDNKGLPHILEHSVLCGSRKYPLREPFVELAKGSLNTYLNAMTYPDKTMYPIASRNAKDFRNLMDVYLDGVFNPNIYNAPEILMQEGWHYELADNNSEITYKGVVYNEMKGALSSPEAILDNKIMETLFPDTAYRFESGGNPEVIPELTYEEFIQFHKQYYHPANAYIYLYGDIDLADNLKFLDEAYLSKFTTIEVPSDVRVQAPFSSPVAKTFDYPVGVYDSVEDKTLLSLTFTVGKTYEAELMLAFEILEYLLLENPAAPLKKALIKAGVGKEVKGSFARYLLQPTFGIIAVGTNEAQEATFIKTITAELERLVSVGIDKKLIEACINKFEFKMREADYGARPKGIQYNTKCLESWLYDKSPMVHFEYTELFEKIKLALTTNYFEQLIEKYLLKNPHRAVVALKPSSGLAEEKERALRQHLAAYKASLTSGEVAELLEKTARLKIRQETPDSLENLATIPLLAIEDIDPNVEMLPLSEECIDGIPVLYHSLDTNGIAYVNFYFDTRRVPQRYLSYVYLLAEILGKVSTVDYAYAELSNEVNLHLGSITYNVAVYTENDNIDVYWPKFIVKTKALVNKLPEVTRLIQQIITGSRFDNSQRIGELIKAVKARWDMTLYSRGYMLAVNRAMSYFSPSASYSEQGMLAFYDFITDLEKNFPGNSVEITSNLANVADLIFSKENLLVSITADEQGYAKFRQTFAKLGATLPGAIYPICQYDFVPDCRNEGLMTAGKVQYVVKAANFRKIGATYHGGLKVLETILLYDYFWTRVRVQGGAYDGFAKIEPNGNVIFASYRDPNLKETLAIFDETADYLREFRLDEREKIKYIIGTINRLDAPLTTAQKGEQAAIRYIRKISTADLVRERQEVLKIQAQQISQFADLIDKVMQQNYLCVLGNEQKIHDNETAFDQIVHLSK